MTKLSTELKKHPLYNIKTFRLKNSLFIFCLLFLTYSFGQSQAVVDSMANEICKTIGQSKETVDSIRVFNSVNIHLEEIIEEMEREEVEELWNKIFFRLQKNCTLFWEILNINSPQTVHWQKVTEIPVSKLTKPDYAKFKKISLFIYMEPNGDTVRVSIKDSQWKEEFADDSYSLLKIKWLNDSTFELSFLSSNNKIRKNYSNPGDKYNYHLIDKGDNYYLVCTGMSGGELFSVFKLFY